MTTGHSYSGQEQAQIRAELDKVLASDRFINANRISGLLRYVVEETLAGRRDRIKAFSIAQDVFRRDASFNQQRDPIVRVEAGRLRKLLTNYYETPDIYSDIRIDIPKGGYAPTFTKQKRVKVRKLGRVSAGAAVISLVCMAVISAYIFWFQLGSGQQAENTSTFLAVLPLAYNQDDVRAADIGENLVDSTISMLARLPKLSVMAHASMMEFDQGGVSLSALRNQYGITHALRGSIETLEDNLRIRLQLIDTESSKTIWSNSLEGSVEDVWLIQDQMASNLINAFSIELSSIDKESLLSRYTDSFEAIALYRQGLVLVVPPSDEKRVQSSKYVFSRVREIAPDFAGGYAGAAWSYALPVLFQSSSTPNENLARAIDYSQQAIQVDPSFGAGYATLGFTQALMGFKVDALENVRLATAIQPGDAFVHFLRGVTLTLLSVPEEAFSSLDEAIRLNPIEKRTPYLNVYGITRFVNREYQLALDLLAKNKEKGGPVGPHMDIFSAAAYAHLGNRAEASAILERIIETAPDFPYAAWLESWIGKGAHLTTTLSKLSESGLQVPDEYLMVTD